MEEMVSYIFGTLNSHDNRLDKIRKTLKKQNKINNNLVILGTMSFAFAVLAELRNRDKIKKLTQEVKELKHTKGD